MYQIFKFIKPNRNSTFNVHSPCGVKLHTILQVGLSLLRDKKLRQNFQDYLDSFCSCGWHIETTIHCFHNNKTKFHCFPYCSNYSDQIKTLFEKVTKNIRKSLLNEIYAAVVGTFLFGLSDLNVEDNALLIESTIEDIIIMKRFIATLL